MSLNEWTFVLNVVTLLVITAAAIAALVQLRHLRAQNTLNGELAILRDWSTEEFRNWRSYAAGPLQERYADPEFMAEYDSPRLDREKHPELNICDWYEQVGSYLKYGLVDEAVLLDVTCASVNRMWIATAPAIERMRATRGNAVYENFEYFAVRGVLYLKSHPHGSYPKHTPRMRDIVFEKPPQVRSGHE